MCAMPPTDPSSGVATSLLSVPEAVSLDGCGFTPVGQVMGCIVQHIGWKGYGCGGYLGSSAVPRTITSGSRNRWNGPGPYADALNRGWDSALTRMLAEASALGADGVVGVRLSQNAVDGLGNREFLALGTAVRGRGRTRAARPFASDLAGQDVAKLLHAGWVPTGIACGISVAVRHDDYRTRSQSRAWGNTEVDGYTELVAQVRHDARTQFGRRATRLGGEVALVSTMSLDVWEHEPSDNHTDHFAQAVVTGTVATRFHRGRTAPTSSLSILPLRGSNPKESTR